MKVCCSIGLCQGTLFCQLLLLYARVLLQTKVDVIHRKIAILGSLSTKYELLVSTKVVMSWKHELGQQIKRERESAGLTQLDLANQLKVSRQMISRYERGEDAPAVDVLVELARLLEIEFRVRGILVKFEQDSKRPKLLHKQLKLEYEKPRRFDGAQIEITPSEGKILIRAEIPA